MEAHSSALTNVAIVVAFAVLAGMVLIRLKQPALVGYMLVGMLLGPTGLHVIDQSESVRLLAEMGVLILLFIVGMELSVKAFARVIMPASLTVLGQVIASLVLAFGAASLLGWSTKTAIVFGFIIALSSTAVAMKILEDVGELRTLTGQIAVGILIAQDLAVVPMLIVVESFEGGQFNWVTLAPKIIIALGLLGAILYFFTRHGKFRFPGAQALRGRTDMLALLGLAICFGAAAISGLAGLSPVYGAFLAGLVLGNSTLRTDIVAVAEPIQNVLLVVFFLSVGLLIDLSYVADNWLTVLILALGVIIVKTLLNVILLRLVGQPWDRAIEAGLVTAQIGEFSFVIAAAGLAGGALDAEAHSLALSVIAATLLLCPVWMDVVRRVARAQEVTEDARWLAQMSRRQGRMASGLRLWEMLRLVFARSPKAK